MLAKTLLSLALLGQYARYPAQNYYPTPPYVPATEQFADYPIHIRILESRWNYDRGSYSGYGRADLLGTDHRGFDFLYFCNEPFKYNRLHGEFYQGKWKKPDQQLEILLQKVGSDHTTRCTLKTTLKEVPYAPDSATWTDPVGAPAPIERR